MRARMIGTCACPCVRSRGGGLLAAIKNSTGVCRDAGRWVFVKIGRNENAESFYAMGNKGCWRIFYGGWFNCLNL